MLLLMHSVISIPAKLIFEILLKEVVDAQNKSENVTLHYDHGMSCVQQLSIKYKSG